MAVTGLLDSEAIRWGILTVVPGKYIAKVLWIGWRPHPLKQTLETRGTWPQAYLPGGPCHSRTFRANSTVPTDGRLIGSCPVRLDWSLFKLLVLLGLAEMRRLTSHSGKTKMKLRLNESYMHLC